MSNARGQQIDKTFLSVDNALTRGFLHRDYIAHCLRWSHAVKRATELKKDCLRVLDIGCGRELQLARTLYTSRLIPDLYVGVDVGPIEKHDVDKLPWFEGHQHTDFARWEDARTFDLITMFEVAEHVEPAHLRRILTKVKGKIALGGYFLLSTPCYDAHVGAADNHVSELTQQAIGWLFEELGFYVYNTFGTFASQKDYKPLLKDYNLEAAFKILSDYYDSNIVSVLFAPLFPEHARNCLWEVGVPSSTFTASVRRFNSPGPEPWGSSERYKDLVGGKGEE